MSSICKNCIENARIASKIAKFAPKSYIFRQKSLGTHSAETTAGSSASRWHSRGRVCGVRPSCNGFFDEKDVKNAFVRPFLAWFLRLEQNLGAKSGVQEIILQARNYSGYTRRIQVTFLIYHDMYSLSKRFRCHLFSCWPLWGVVSNLLSCRLMYVDVVQF